MLRKLCDDQMVGLRVRHASLIVLVSVLAVVSQATSASAGGSWFDPVKDRYEPGEEATLVGYTGGGAYGWIEDGPFFGFLVDSNENGEMVVDGPRRPLGQIILEDTGAGGYLRLRASITFTIPSDLEPGVYLFDYCNADCTERLGDLIGGMIYVGVDPTYPVSREWPLDDPEVANLDDAARLSGPGFDLTAGQVRDVSTDDRTTRVSASPDRQTTAVLPSSLSSDEVAATSTTDGLEGPELAITADVAAFREPDDSIPWIYGGIAALVAAGLGAAIGRRRRASGPDADLA